MTKDLLSSEKASCISACSLSSSICLRFRKDSISASFSATAFNCNTYVHSFYVATSFSWHTLYTLVSLSYFLRRANTSRSH